MDEREVISLDYRLAPINPYPAALEDAFASYEYLLKKGYKPENIIFVGDSAGGGFGVGFNTIFKRSWVVIT